MGNCVSNSVNFEDEINLYHFVLHRAVGKGAFGKVRVVEHKGTKKVYALKYIEKTKCIKQKAVANIIQERRLLEEVDHPFVVNMRYAFQDDENCFFVLDLMLGGDLRFHLERQQGVPENVVRFWMAEVASALEYLHQQRIIHRDIKPDNILLDAAGHAHITDFNVAIHYSERRLHTSVAGSMAYMAPEVVGRQGYTWCIDYWSLGVTMYELIFRRRPFEGRSVEKMRQSIMKESVKFPEGASAKCSPEGIQFVKSLLNRVPGERLGCRPNGQGIIDIHEHPWMQGIDWDALDNKELPPPFTPDVGCQPFPRPLADTHILYPQMKKANFDVTHELDEFLMVEKPLTHTKRKVNPDFEKMKPELRQMEEEFTVYDFSCNKRMSYYPHNQPIVNAGHEDDSDTPSLTLSTAQTLLPTATIGERSLAGSPMPDETQNYPPLPSPVQVLHH